MAATITTAAVGLQGLAAGAAAAPTQAAWTPTNLPMPSTLPNGATPQSFAVESTSCSSASFCVAVGGVSDGNQNGWPLAEVFSGGTWAATVLPTPSNASTNFYGGTLFSVSCPADGVCAAVGDYNSYSSVDNANHQNGLLETLSGGAWTVSEAQLPQGPDSGLLNLRSISCSSVNLCQAVGDVYNFDATGTFDGLDYTLQSGAWGMQVVPVPANFQNSLIMNSVSCPDDGHCVAVGTYEDSDGDTHGLLLTFASGAWSAAEAPLPPSAATASQPGQNRPFEALNGVDCPEVGWCLAGGYFVDSGYNLDPVLIQLENGTWTAVQVPVPADSQANTLGAIQSVYCPAVAFCIATGYYWINFNTGNESGLIVTDSNGTLISSEAPLPTGNTTEAALEPTTPAATVRAATTASTATNLAGVSCGSDSYCVAVGNTNQSALAESNDLSGLPAVTAVTPSSGPVTGGTKVTISGTNFSPQSVVHFGNTAAASTYVSPTELTAIAPAVPAAKTVDVIVSGDGLGSRADAQDRFTYITLKPCPKGETHKSAGEPWAVASTSSMVAGRQCPGYWVVTRSGGVTAIGAAPWLGDLSGHALNAPVIGIAATADHRGYYLLGADGGIFTFGDAHFHGSTGNLRLNAPIVSMAVSPRAGYWLVASDGGIFSFGGAPFYGSTGDVHLARPIVAMSVDGGTGGYWMVAADGGIFSFHAPYFGSTGGVRLAQPIVGMSPQPDARGYRLVAHDGGVFDFGDAAYLGSLPGRGVTNPDVTTMGASVDGRGYYLINAAGTVWGFGDAPFLGNA